MNINIRAKRFRSPGEAQSRTVLKNISFSLGFGQFVAVFGPSGCGKTTLLNIIAGLDADFDGSVNLMSDGRCMEAEEKDHRHPVIGYVFQNPRLLPWKTVEENVRLVLRPRGGGEAKVVQILRDVGVDDVRHVYPNRLSVGMSRRVALARAFVVAPDILLMDEPFVSIDVATANRLRGLLLGILRSRPTIVLYVTHDLSEAIHLADRILFLSGAPAEIVSDVLVDVPRDHRTKEAVERFRARLLDDDDGTIREVLGLGE
jgi:NitT/TauT family transport system ATP-binding protein